MSTGKSVLIPLDGSENSRRAFDWAIENVIKPEDTVVLVHVVEPPVLNTLSLSSGMKLPTEEWEKNITAGIKRAEGLRDDYSVDCQSKKLKHEFYSITSKSPGEGICDFLQEKNVTMVVIGNRGLGKLKRAFLGSVSDYVIHHSSVPVTVVPPQKE